MCGGYFALLPKEIFKIIVTYLTPLEYCRMQQLSRAFLNSFLLEDLIQKALWKEVDVPGNAPGYLLGAIIHGKVRAQPSQIQKLMTYGYRMDQVLKLCRTLFSGCLHSPKTFIKFLRHKPSFSLEDYQRHYHILRRMVIDYPCWFYFLTYDEHVIKHLPREDLEYFLEKSFRLMPEKEKYYQYLIPIYLEVLRALTNNNTPEMIRILEEQKSKSDARGPFFEAMIFELID